MQWVSGLWADHLPDVLRSWEDGPVRHRRDQGENELQTRLDGEQGGWAAADVPRALMDRDTAVRTSWRMVIRVCASESGWGGLVPSVWCRQVLLTTKLAMDVRIKLALSN